MNFMLCMNARQRVLLALLFTLITPIISGGGRGIAAESAKAEILNFTLSQGKIHNAFYRQGPVAAHTVLTSGLKPRLIVAFPAGNSGVSLWFKKQATPTVWHTVDHMTAVTETTASGALLHGITAEITVDTAQLTLEKAVLGSVRTIRNYMHGVALPAALTSSLERRGNRLVWSRPGLDHRGGYKLSLEVMDGAEIVDAANEITFRAAPGKTLRLRILALTGDKPLTPIESAELLNDKAAPDLLSRQVLTFLSYKEKMLAGSWRFLTYFGRDTLLSVRLLQPVLRPEAIEAGLGSVIERLKDNGEVAHEEDIGEFALLRHQEAEEPLSRRPIYDYNMIDDDYMLPAIMAHYLLNDETDPARVEAFLARKTTRGETYGAALMANFAFVLKSATPFAQEAVASHLISIKDGSKVGDWRDSQEGLGGGTYSYNVNAIFVPAALKAIGRLGDSGILHAYMSDKTIFTQASSYARIWRTQAPDLFKVVLAAAKVKAEVTAYAASQGISATPALASLDDAPVTYYALALDRQGTAIPVLQSDIGYMMLFDRPSEVEIMDSLRSIMRPFPAGLMTPVGLVVANPAFAPQALQDTFTKGNYHGTVIWSWQQALLAEGLKHQLDRDDLSQDVRTSLIKYQQDLWQVITESQKVKTSELWSWRAVDGKFVYAPFGQERGHMTESNAAQLWSTVYLAIQPPAVSK